MCPRVARFFRKPLDPPVKPENDRLNGGFRIRLFSFPAIGTFCILRWFARNRCNQRFYARYSSVRPSARRYSASSPIRMWAGTPTTRSNRRAVSECVLPRCAGLYCMSTAWTWVCSLRERELSRDAGRLLLRPTGTECPNPRGAQAPDPRTQSDQPTGGNASD